MREKRGLVPGLVIGLVVGAMSFTVVGAGAVDTHEDRPFDGVLVGDLRQRGSGRPGSGQRVPHHSLRGHRRGTGKFADATGWFFSRGESRPYS